MFIRLMLVALGVFEAKGLSRGDQTGGGSRLGDSARRLYLV